MIIQIRGICFRPEARVSYRDIYLHSLAHLCVTSDFSLSWRNACQHCRATSAWILKLEISISWAMLQAQSAWHNNKAENLVESISIFMRKGIPRESGPMDTIAKEKPNVYIPSWQTIEVARGSLCRERGCDRVAHHFPLVRTPSIPSVKISL